jgi:hypothetical protein
VSTDPGVANVLTGTNYTINSVGKTGTLTSTDPGVANVVSGVGYQINSTSKTGTYVEPTAAQVKHAVAFGPSSSLTGTYTGSDLWSDPGVNNVLNGINYNANGVALTGTLSIAGTIIQLSAATLQSPTASPVSNNLIQFSQGDTINLSLIAADGNGNPINITGASFQTQILGPNGQAIATFGNSQHSILSASGGNFQLSLTAANTAACGLGPNKDIVTQITIGSSVAYFRGNSLLTVWPGIPLQ